MAVRAGMFYEAEVRITGVDGDVMVEGDGKATGALPKGLQDAIEELMRSPDLGKVIADKAQKQ
jgi:hypothetical protein